MNKHRASCASTKLLFGMHTIEEISSCDMNETDRESQVNHELFAGE